MEMNPSLDTLRREGSLALPERYCLKIMEYQYYVDQIKNQTDSVPGTGLEVAAANFEDSAQTSSELESQSSFASGEPQADAINTSLPPSSDQVKSTLATEEEHKNDFKYLVEQQSCPLPLARRRALPLVDAFRRRQRYVESLITCSSAALQCTMDGDTMSYLRFRAKNESIVCELTNARARLGRTSGPLNLARTRNWDPELIATWLTFLFFVTAITVYLFLSKL